MQTLNRYIRYFSCFAALGWMASIAASNQTEDLSPVLPGSQLPFSIEIKLADFQLPDGLHSNVSAIWDGKWLLLAGRVNGMHGFNNNDDNFPPSKQNTTLYVIDPIAKRAYSRSLEDSYSGLTQNQIDLLSVTSPQAYQSGSTLYMTGGYGVDSSTGLFDTKDVLTALDVPGLIHWVLHPTSDKKAASYIRHLSHPIFQVTGGYMAQMKKNEPTLLVFGQNFTGFYRGSSNGNYTMQVRAFHIIDDGEHLDIRIKGATPEIPDPDFRRRDLNVIPCVECKKGKLSPYLTALSGVFTPTDGMWTVPVTIFPSGKTFMEDPSSPTAFKQAMNNYVSASVGMFSEKHDDMYTVLLGGISFGYFSNGSFMTDPELPFINQITTIRRNKERLFEQFLMDGQYPVILSTGSNPGNPLLFGAGAGFMPADGLPMYSNSVVKYDELKKHKKNVLGYIVGGIQSTVPNTQTMSDSTGSPYIFEVILHHSSH